MEMFIVLFAKCTLINYVYRAIELKGQVNSDQPSYIGPFLSLHIHWATDWVKLKFWLTHLLWARSFPGFWLRHRGSTGSASGRGIGSAGRRRHPHGGRPGSSTSSSASRRGWGLLLLLLLMLTTTLWCQLGHLYNKYNDARTFEQGVFKENHTIHNISSKCHAIIVPAGMVTDPLTYAHRMTTLTHVMLRANNSSTHTSNSKAIIHNA